MATVMGAANMIRRIVRLRQMIRGWRNKARSSLSSRRGVPSDVPAGHVAVLTVSGRRFVVRATYLNHPVFVKLLSAAEEEYGLRRDGPLTVPCDESALEDVIRVVSGSTREIACGKADEFRPLLNGLVQKPVW